MEVAVFTYKDNYRTFFDTLDRLHAEGLACNMRLEDQVRFVRDWFDSVHENAGIWIFKDAKTRQVVGVVVVLLGTVYMSRDRLGLEDNRPGLRKFGLWNKWELKNTSWLTSSVVRVLCAKPQYLHAVIQRLVRSPQLGAGVLQVSVPLEDVPRFLKYEGFSLGLTPDTELTDLRNKFFSGDTSPEPTAALATALYPVLVAQENTRKELWAGVDWETNARRAREALAQGIILSRKQ
jgi:hypothetical protein